MECALLPPMSRLKLTTLCCTAVSQAEQGRARLKGSYFSFLPELPLTGPAGQQPEPDL